MTGEFYYNETLIPYTDTGGGPVVVLLHGFAETGELWQKQTDFLQKNYRVLIPEIPAVEWTMASGATADLQLQTNLSALTTPFYELPVAFRQMDNTTKADDMPIAKSIDAMADALAAFIQKMTTGPVVLLGHSMGGYTTLALAEKYPHLLKAFGLIHSTAFADTEEKKVTRRKGIEFMRQHSLEAFFKTSAPGLFSDATKRDMPECLTQNVAMATRYQLEVLIANYEAMMMRPDRSAVLQGSEIPVLFIIGKEDKATPAADLLKQVHLPAVSYFHLLDDVAHMGMWEAPDKVNALISKFLEDCA